MRHTLVKGGASPDDPSLAAYWERRRQKVKPPLDPSVVRLLTRQDGRCSLCGENLLTPGQPPQSPEGWEHWFQQVTRMAITADYLAAYDRPAPGTMPEHTSYTPPATDGTTAGGGGNTVSAY